MAADAKQSLEQSNLDMEEVRQLFDQLSFAEPAAVRHLLEPVTQTRKVFVVFPVFVCCTTGSVSRRRVCQTLGDGTTGNNIRNATRTSASASFSTGGQGSKRSGSERPSASNMKITNFCFR